MKKSDKIGTIHDAKNELSEFFKEFDKERIDHEEVKLLKEKLKALRSFNKIVDKKRQEVENNLLARINVKNNDDILRNRKKVELEIPKNIRSILSSDYQQLKLKEFFLKPINEETYKNYINYYSGKKFDFILNTGFNKHKIGYDEIKKDSVLSEKNIVLSLLEKYKQDVDKAYKYDKDTTNKKEFKAKQKVYEKIYRVIEHNKNITSGKEKKSPFKKNDKGDFIRTSGEYPIMFELLDFVMNIYIS